MERNPNTRWLTWLLIALLLGGAAAAYVVLNGCASTPTLEVIHREVAYAYLDVQDAQDLATDQGTKDVLADVAAGLSKVNTALEAYMANGDPESQQGLFGALQAAIRVVEAVLADDLPEEARVGLLLLKSSLRRWQGYAGGPAPVLEEAPAE